MRKLRLILPAAVMTTCLAFGVAQAGAASGQVVYNSLPAKGVVQVPSEGAEAAEFNQLGNEVILTKATTVKKVSVTMVSWACQTGGWSTGDCVDGRHADVPNAGHADPLQAQHR